MKNSKTRFYWSLGINILIFLIECYVISNAYFGFVGSTSGGQKALMFRFFTEDSNILLGISCLIYVIVALVYAKKNKPFPLWIRRLKFIAITAVTTTFMVVFLFLDPYIGFSYGGGLAFFAMWSWPNMCFTHFLCPVLSVLSFLFLEEKEDSPYVMWKEAFFPLIPVLLYAIIVGTLAGLKVFSATDSSINNVYGFMDPTVRPWGSALAFVLIPALTYGEGYLWLFVQKKIAAKQKEKIEIAEQS
jgi:hypothetical protein